jgi:hypothetical protein
MPNRCKRAQVHDDFDHVSRDGVKTLDGLSFLLPSGERKFCRKPALIRPFWRERESFSVDRRSRGGAFASIAVRARIKRTRTMIHS